MERVVANVVPRAAEPGDVLIREGDVGDRFYMIAGGTAEVKRGGRPIATLGPGSYVGEIALLRDVPRTATVVATTSLQLLTLEREPFLLAVTGHPPSHAEASAVAETRMPSSSGPVSD
jgi:CRP-like cAMP-binding protein